MTDVEIEVRVYKTPDGRCPFDDWLLALRDVHARARIRARIARVRQGNFGDSKRHWRAHKDADRPLS